MVGPKRNTWALNPNTYLRLILDSSVRSSLSSYSLIPKTRKLSQEKIICIDIFPTSPVLSGEKRQKKRTVTVNFFFQIWEHFINSKMVDKVNVGREQSFGTLPRAEDTHGTLI